MTIGIIGFGRFGALVASVFKQFAKVRVHQYKNNANIKAKAKIIGVQLTDFKTTVQSDIVIIAAPISKTEDVIKKAAKYVKDGALVVDTCSVKTYPCQWLKKYLPETVDIMGTHPMFGPVTANFNLEKQTWTLKNHQIVLCPLRISWRKLKKIKKFLSDLGLKVIQSTPEDHDRQNAITLSLVHFLGRSLWQAKIRDQKIYTPGFADLLKIYRHTTGDTWELFYDMNNYNPYAQETRQKFLDACYNIEDKVEEHSDFQDLQFYRSIIDRADKEVLRLLAKRFEYVKKIALLKKEQGLPMIDKKREAGIVENNIKRTELDKDFIKKLYKLIFDEAYKKQK